MPLSLRNRLLLLLLFLFTLTWFCMMLATYYISRHEIEEVFEAQMAQLLNVLHDLTLHEIEEMQGVPGHIEFHESEPLHPYQKKMAFQAWDRGNLILRSPNAPETILSTINGYSDTVSQGEQWHVLSQVFADSEIQFIVGVKTEVRNELVMLIMTQVFWPILITLPLLTLLILYGIQRGLKPLTTLSNEIARRNPRQLTAVSSDDIPIEISPVIQSLNDLLARLQQALDKERQFTADAAHELRTPLAALKAQAQVAGRASEPSEQRQAIDNIIRGMDRLAHIVEQLLTLARLDPENASQQHEPLNLLKIAEQISSELAPLAIDKNIDFELLCTEDCIIQGDQTSISILMRNLIDNAIRYTPANGAVSLRVYAGDQGCVFSVSDTGPGIPAAEHERVLHRFYRIVGSGEVGSGLGLSIARRIMELHGGYIRFVKPGQGQGIEVQTVFPLMTKRNDES